MSEPDKTQTNPPAGGEQSKQLMPGLFIPPEARAVEQTSTPTQEEQEKADANLQFAANEDGAPEKEENQEPVKFTRYNSDEEELAATGLSFSEMKNREKKPAEEKKEEVKQPVVQPQQQQKTNQQQQQRQLPAERDYSGIDEVDVPLFKKMSNDSFSKMKELYAERKQLKQEVETYKNKKPDDLHPSLYNHPNGYMLDAKFNELNAVANLADQAEEHWQRQLIRIQNGKDWTDLSYDEKTGRLVESEPKVADEASQIYASKSLRRVQATSMDVSRQRDEYIKSFNGRFKENRDFVSGIITQYFPGHEKPDHPTAQAQKQILNLLPESMRDLPTTPLLCIIAAHNIMLQQQVAKLSGNKTVAQAVMNDAKNAPPPASAFKTGAGAGTGPSYSAMRNRG